MPRGRKSTNNTLDEHIEELNTLLKKHAIIELRIKKHQEILEQLIKDIAKNDEKTKKILIAHKKSLIENKKTIDVLIRNQRKITSYGENVHKNINGVAQNKTDIKKLSLDLEKIKQKLQKLNNNVDITFRNFDRIDNRHKKQLEHNRKIKDIFEYMSKTKEFKNWFDKKTKEENVAQILLTLNKKKPSSNIKKIKF